MSTRRIAALVIAALVAGAVLGTIGIASGETPAQSVAAPMNCSPTGACTMSSSVVDPGAACGSNASGACGQQQAASPCESGAACGTGEACGDCASAAACAAGDAACGASGECASGSGACGQQQTASPCGGECQ